MLAIFGLAAFLRCWQLSEVPPGLYRDEAFNGLDALRVLDGEWPLFFPANNGREPLFIYLVAASISFFGRTAFAIRFPAALIGSLTVFPFYSLTKMWFDRRVGLLAAYLWAITIWPLHLSRVGFRVILLPFTLSIAALAGTYLYRRWRQDSAENNTQRPPALWLLALFVGALYGLTFYSYLAAQLSVLFLLLFIVLLYFQRRERFVWPMMLTVAIGALLLIVPLIIARGGGIGVSDGRTAQVSLFNAGVNGGNLLASLATNFGRTLAMFTFQGDPIIRHNPNSLPVFNWLLSIPFLIGSLWLIKHWRKPASFACLLWVGTFALGTILAEDAPHFLRSAGILPVILIFPAIGLAWLLNCSKLQAALGKIIVSALLLGSCFLTVKAYFVDYAEQAETAFYFEAPARTLAEEVNQRMSEDVDVLLDQQFIEQWQAVPFLLNRDREFTTFNKLAPPHVKVDSKTAVFVWPHEPTDFVADLVPDGAKVAILPGDFARGDLDPEPYLFAIEYLIEPNWVDQGQDLNFDNQVQLVDVSAEMLEIGRNGTQFSISLTWQLLDENALPLSAFVHVIDKATGQLIAQADAPIGGPYWPTSWWKRTQFIEESREITLERPFDRDEQTIFIGVYDSNQTRLPLLNANGVQSADRWEFRFE